LILSEHLRFYFHGRDAVCLTSTSLWWIRQHKAPQATVYILFKGYIYTYFCGSLHTTADYGFPQPGYPVRIQCNWTNGITIVKMYLYTHYELLWGFLSFTMRVKQVILRASTLEKDACKTQQKCIQKGEELMMMMLMDICKQLNVSK